MTSPTADNQAASESQPTPAAAGQALASPTLGEIVRTTMHLGAVGYGGPAILALMKQTLVGTNKLIRISIFK